MREILNNPLDLSQTVNSYIASNITGLVSLSVILCLEIDRGSMVYFNGDFPNCKWNCLFFLASNGKCSQRKWWKWF